LFRERQFSIRKSVEEVVQEFVQSHRDAKCTEEDVRGLEYRLGRFKNAFRTRIAEVARSNVLRFVVGLGLSAHSQFNFRKALRTLFEFASYRLAQLQNADQVALETGHSAKVLFTNYRELVTPEEAKRWFGIVPDNVNGG
jgi:hypothetical protein